MKILFSWFLYILFPFQNFALERIWLVRHCDKPKDTNNPCCSEMGYQRANMWYQYFQSWLNPENKIKVITSRFNKKKVCIPNIDTNIENDSDNKCQKSQRMWITGFYIYRDLQIKFNLHSIMNTQYCIGQYKEMLKHILDKEKNKEKDDTTDAIIVWEHNEMIDIIQHFGIKIDKWKNENIYDIVFMMDVTKKPRLFYDCFSLEKDSDDCHKETEKWLKKFKKIPHYYSNDIFLIKSSMEDVPFVFKVITLGFFFLIMIIVPIYICFCHPVQGLRYVDSRTHPYMNI